MILKLKNPLVFFDLETTGKNVATDRIVEISLIKLTPKGERITKTKRVNPTIPIPYATSLIHGIYDKDVAQEPTFKELANEIVQFIEGCDLAGFNVLRFDIPVLMEELLRADIDFDIKNQKIVDVQRIYHMMEPRNLEAAYHFYCGKKLENAHSAEADVTATLEVLEAQVEKYDSKTILQNGKETQPIKNDIQILHELSSSNLVDFAGRMLYNDQGQEIFNFGKHKDKLVCEVLKNEPTYYDWMMKGDFTLDTKRKLTQIKLRELNK